MSNHIPLERHREKRWLYAACVLSVLAGLIHVAVAPEHFEEWIGYGVFFVVASAAQWLFPFLLLAYGPKGELLWTGIIGNSLIIALWLMTRTIGIPFFGPEAGEVEPVGAVDTIAKVTELALIACLVMMLRLQRSTAGPTT